MVHTTDVAGPGRTTRHVEVGPGSIHLRPAPGARAKAERVGPVFIATVPSPSCGAGRFQRRFSGQHAHRIA